MLYYLWFRLFLLRASWEVIYFKPIIPQKSAAAIIFVSEQFLRVIISYLLSDLNYKSHIFQQSTHFAARQLYYILCCLTRTVKRSQLPQRCRDGTCSRWGGGLFLCQGGWVAAVDWPRVGDGDWWYCWFSKGEGGCCCCCGGGGDWRCLW